jgi:hypothetical protein
MFDNDIRLYGIGFQTGIPILSIPVSSQYPLALLLASAPH